MSIENTQTIFETTDNKILQSFSFYTLQNASIGNGRMPQIRTSGILLVLLAENMQRNENSRRLKIFREVSLIV